MIRTALLFAAMLHLIATPGLGHEGPPYPIITDRVVGPYTVSVWTDPDIGIGTFFVVMERTDGGEISESVTVRVGVAPETGRLEEVVYEARRERQRGGARFVAEVEFDRGEWWEARIVVDGPEGGGEMTSLVEATPDGSIGPIGLLVYMFPFVAVGYLWWRGTSRRRAELEAEAGSAPGNDGPDPVSS